MGLFGKKKKGNPETENNAAEAVNAKASAKEEKQRLKRIEKMCSKFDETVWVSIIEVLREQIPNFIMEYEGSKKFITFGFDTSVVDDFVNTKDPDIGQLYNIIKTDMDVVIENGLLSHQMILFIPTEKTLTHMNEYSDEFGFKYKIVLCDNDDDKGEYTVLTYDVNDQPIELSYAQIDDMYGKGNAEEAIKALIKSDGKSDEEHADTLDGGKGEAYDAPDDDIEHEIDLNANGPEIDDPADEIPEEEVPVEDEIPAEEISEEMPEEEVPNEDPVEDTQIDASVLTGAVAEASDAAKNGDDVEAAEARQQTRSIADRAQRLAKKNKVNSAVQAAVQVAAGDADVAKSNIANQRQAPAITEEMIDQFIVRKFYSDELDLEVSTAPFDASITQGNRYQPFEYVESSESCSEWLNNYLNNLRADANTKLLRMHNENITMLREHYTLLVTRHCEEVMKNVDINNPTTKFGAMKLALNNQRSQSVASIQDSINKEIEALNAEKERVLQDRIAAATAAAKAGFDRDILPQFEQKRKTIQESMQASIEIEYNDGIKSINEARREEAKRQLDIGINEILVNIHDEYAKMLAIEKEEYNRLQGIISEFEKANMAADLAHAQTIQADLDRTNKVKTIQEEYESKMDLTRSEFELKLNAAYEDIRRKNLEHNDEIIKLKKKHDELAAQTEAKHGEEVDKLNAEIQDLSEQLRALTDQYVNLEAVTNDKYKNQIDEIKSEREAWEERADHLEHIHKYTDKIKITVAIISVIAAMGIGVIIGASYMAKQVESKAVTNTTTQQPVINYHTTEDDSSDESSTGIEVEDLTNEDGGNADE